MLERWLTGRCAAADLPALRQTRAGIRTFLSQQDANWSGTEPFAGATRPNTFTFHNGNGRGAVWRDDERGVLWLCCASDLHDGGYAHGHQLADDDRLYPQLDPAFVPGVGTAAVWGTYADEDALESLRFVGDAVHAFRELSSGADQTETFDNGVGFIRLGVEDGVWTMTIRRPLIYSDETSKRDRWLTDDELRRVFAQITGLDPDDEDNVDWWVPPHDGFHVNIDFLGGILPPSEWLDRRVDALIDEEDDQALTS